MKKTLFYIAIFVLFPTLSHASFDYNLKYGAKGNAVIELQEFLTDQGVYSGPISGNFFSLTRSAVAKFQLNNGIKPQSGYFGPLTRTKANEILVAQLDESNADEQSQVGKVETPVQDTTNYELVAQVKELNAKLSQVEQNTKKEVMPEPLAKVVEKKKGTLVISATDNGIGVALWRSEYTDADIKITPPDNLVEWHPTKECGKLSKNGHDYCSYTFGYVLKSSKDPAYGDYFDDGSKFTFAINAFGQDYSVTLGKGEYKTLLSDE